MPLPLPGRPRLPPGQPPRPPRSSNTPYFPTRGNANGRTLCPDTGPAYLTAPHTQLWSYSWLFSSLSLDCELPDGRAQFDSFLDSQHPVSTVLGQGEKFDKYLLISEKESVKEIKRGFLSELLFRTATVPLPPGGTFFFN